jgi:hypothetical protein
MEKQTKPPFLLGAGLFGLVALNLALSSPLRAADGKAGPKYGPLGSPIAVPLSVDSRYFRNPQHPAPDFWTLMPFYVSQFNELSCSAAAVTIVLNGFLRSGTALKDSDKNITQRDLLELVKVLHWKERVAKGGYLDQYGLTLSQLREVLAASLKAYGIQEFRIAQQTVQATGAKTLSEWRRVLTQNETSANDFVVVHFVQDTLTMASGGPYAHISPVGAYDAGNKRVLLLDVDRDYYQPYWVSDELLLKAMSVKTASFGHGGWLRVDRK